MLGCFPCFRSVFIRTQHALVTAGTFTARNLRGITQYGWFHFVRPFSGHSSNSLFTFQSHQGLCTSARLQMMGPPVARGSPSPRCGGPLVTRVLDCSQSAHEAPDTVVGKQQTRAAFTKERYAEAKPPAGPVDLFLPSGQPQAPTSVFGVGW